MNAVLLWVAEMSTRRNWLPQVALTKQVTSSLMVLIWLMSTMIKETTMCRRTDWLARTKTRPI
jgi:hypothetical protein